MGRTRSSAAALIGPGREERNVANPIVRSKEAQRAKALVRDASFPRIPRLSALLRRGPRGNEGRSRSRSSLGLGTTAPRLSHGEVLTAPHQHQQHGAGAETAALVLATVRISASAGTDQAAGDRESAASPRQAGSRGRGSRRGRSRSKGEVIGGAVRTAASTGSFAEVQLAPSDDGYCSRGNGSVSPVDAATLSQLLRCSSAVETVPGRDQLSSRRCAREIAEITRMHKPRHSLEVADAHWLRRS